MKEIHEFFENFSSDFSHFNGNLIAERYFAPFIPVTSSGEAKTLNSHSEISSYFQGYLDTYKEKGVVACTFKDFEWLQIGENAFVAIVTWLLTDENDGVIISWRESYNLLRQEGQLLVYSSANFK